MKLGIRSWGGIAAAVAVIGLGALAMAQPTACGTWVPRLPLIVKKPKSLAEYMIGNWRPLIGSAALE